MRKAVFIAATGQNIGKTTVCLGILSGLCKRIPSVGFLKPVGQQHNLTSENTHADKDVILFKDHFHLKSSYASMSPVICPHGFTRDFLDHKISEDALLEKIKQSFTKLAAENEYVLVEGTGHIGVGSIFHLNNAIVAKRLGLDVVIVASGGLGSSFDELALNITMCLSHGVRVRGIILNKVQSQKRAMVLDYFPKSLEPFQIPLIGCVPYEPFLTSLSMNDLETLFHTKLISGHQERMRHFENICVADATVDVFLQEKGSHDLVVTSSSREDIIELMLQDTTKCGLLLTGNISSDSFKRLENRSLPILTTSVSTFQALKMINAFSAKIKNEDAEKVTQAIELVEKNINFNMLL